LYTEFGVQTLRHLQLQPDLAEQAYDQILAAICEGDLAPGARVTQEALAARLNVSRQPIMQALLLLKREGFLCEAGRRGLMVAPLDRAYVENLYEIRAALDGVAARGAARDSAAAARRSGPTLIAAGRSAVAGRDLKRLVAADVEFHRFLYELSGNPLLAETASLHLRHIRRIMAQYLSHGARLDKVWDEHAAILKKVIAGDEEGAERLARRHAEDSARHIVAQISDETPTRAAV
jgi:DNA-binding GntR family transcriptional regulator